MGRFAFVLNGLTEMENTIAENMIAIGFAFIHLC